MLPNLPLFGLNSGSVEKLAGERFEVGRPRRVRRGHGGMAGYGAAGAG